MDREWMYAQGGDAPSCYVAARWKNEKGKGERVVRRVDGERVVARRELVYAELLARAQEKVAREEKQRRRARQDFQQLLRDSRHLRHDSSWEDALPELEKHSAFKAVRQCHNKLYRAYCYSPYPGYSYMIWAISQTRPARH